MGNCMQSRLFHDILNTNKIPRFYDVNDYIKFEDLLYYMVTWRLHEKLWKILN